MTLVSSIITAAMRETNLIGATATPTDPEFAEGLSRLQALVLSTLGGDAGYIMEDWAVQSATVIIKPSGVQLSSAAAAAFTVAPNARLVCALTAETTVTLDPYPQDGQRFAIVDAIDGFATNNLLVDPNGRKFAGSSSVATLSAPADAGQWFYRADLADWKAISPLALADAFVFPEDFDDYFIISLALRLNPRHGKALTDDSKTQLERQRQQMLARYSQSRLAPPPAPAAQ